MITAPEHPNEPERLASLHQCNILDTEPEQGFDDITQLAAHTCQTPIALVSLLDKDRQWFKSKVGINETETPREIAFCAYAILQDGIFIVPDTLQDARFADNPLVTFPPNIRFYAGVPIKTSEGYPIGTLCVIDYQPRELSKEQISCLRSLARQIAYIVATRRSLAGINHSIPIATVLPHQVKESPLKKIVFWSGLAASMVIGMSITSFVNLSNIENLNIAAIKQVESIKQKITDYNSDNSQDKVQLKEILELENQLSEKRLYSIKLSTRESISTSAITLIATLSVLGLLIYRFNQEINVRRRLASSLERERDFTVTVLDNVDTLVIVMDSKGNIIRFNNECESLSGYHYEEVRNQSFSKIFLSDQDAKLFNQDITKSHKNTFTVSYENEWKKKNGETRLISWSVTELVNQEKDSKFIIVTGLDVTEQKQAEEEIRLQNWRSLVFSKITLRIRQSLDISEILSTTVHEIRRFLNCDRVVVYQSINADWHGDTVAESVASPWMACLGIDIADTCSNEWLWDEYRQGRKVIDDDVVNSDTPECYKALMARLQIRANLVVPILKSDHLWGLLIAHQCSEPRHWRKFEIDFVTEIGNQVGIALYQAMLLDQETQRREQLSQKNLELEEARYQAETATEMKSAFLATMSHEIRTPMNAVLGMTGLLADSELSFLQRDFVETIRVSGENLLTLINEILDFSKLEAREMELEEINFDLNTGVEEVTDLLAMMAQSKGLELAALIYQNVPLHLCGDVARLRQVLTNLISNAIKFTAKGEVIVKVTLKEKNDANVIIEFRIIDTGIGISPEAQKKLFQPFTQVDASTTRKYGGTGLGLAICKQIVELMGGEIGIDSEEGKGSQFWFTIPFLIQSPEAIAQTKPHREVNLKDIRVLVVDDSETNCKILTYQLTAWQMRVDAVQKSSDAIAVMRTAIAEGDPYKLAILDMQMPDLDGEMLGTQIKAESGLKDIKLIMLTSLNQHGGINRVKDLKFEYYLVKPVKQSRLLDVLMEVVMAEANSDAFMYSRPNNTRLTDNPDPLSSNPQVQKSSKLKILIAEDNLINQKVALHQLRSFGYDADVAGNGKEVLNLLERIDYHIILMDCQMPELDGYETTKAIRRLDSGKSKVVIVAMTANAMKEDRDRCIAVGMDDYLSKPIRKEDLAQKLAEWEIKIFAESQSEYPVEDGLRQGYNSNKDISEDQVMEGETILIDWSFIDNIVDGNAEFKDELLQTFYDCTVPILNQLGELISTEQYIQIKRMAHIIKGSAANIGIVSMAAIANDLERLSINDDAILEDKTQLKQQMHQDHQTLQNLLSQVHKLINK